MFPFMSCKLGAEHHLIVWSGFDWLMNYIDGSGPAEIEHPVGAGLWFTCWVCYGIFPSKIQSLVIRGGVYYYYGFLLSFKISWVSLGEDGWFYGSCCLSGKILHLQWDSPCLAALLPPRLAATTSYCHEVPPKQPAEIWDFWECSELCSVTKHFLFALK